MLRWSEEDLKKHLNKTGTSSSVAQNNAIKEIKQAIHAAPVTQKASSVDEKGKKPPIKKKKPIGTKKKEAPSNGDLFADVDPPVKAKKKPSTAYQRSKLAVESIKQSKVSGVQVAGKYIEFSFDGARLLSLNDMYALHHFERVDYRKAWHDVIHDAILEITGGPRHLFKFNKFHIQAHRVSTQYCDLDALVMGFKYAIDGLRYAGIIEDDNPKYMVSIAATQEKGPHQIRLRVQAVSEENVTQPIASGSVSSNIFDDTRPL